MEPEAVQAGDAVVAEIRRRLNTIIDPCSAGNGVPMGLDDMGLVETVSVDRDGNARIRLRLTSPTCHMVGYFKVEAEELVQEIPSVRTVEVTADHGLDWSPQMMSDAAKQRRRVALLAKGISLPT